jgi:MFS family permease
MERVASERSAFYYYYGAYERTTGTDVTTGETYTEVGSWTTLKAFWLSTSPSPQTSHLKQYVFLESCNSHRGFVCLPLNKKAYMFYQLKWFDPSLPDSTISSQAGVLHASFTASQFLTAMMWGRIADSKRVGRKTVLLIGLLGTSISCLGFGFSTTFWQALLFRTVGGATNGNIGVMRTM